MTRGELEQRTLQFAARVFAFANVVRAQPGARGPAGQLIDSATSVAANYRATARARSRAEFVSKLSVVAEEADETVYWLEFTVQAAIARREAVAPLLDEARELRAIFAASVRTARLSLRQR